MSNEATFALPISQPVVLRESTHTSAWAEQSFTFVSQRWQRGVTVGAGALVQLALGLFLLAEIQSTPGLKSQLALLGSILVVTGVACLVSASRDLFGRLVINNDGISVQPFVAGFSIPWEKIVRCQVKDLHSRHAESPYILLWTRDSACPVYIPYGWLSTHDRHQVQQVLAIRVPSDALAG